MNSDLKTESTQETTPVGVVLTFFIHVLAVFGSMAMAHQFFPGSTTWMFFLVLGGVLLTNWHRNPDQRHSVLGLVFMGLKRGNAAVQARRSTPKLIDTLPPENPKHS